LTRQAKGANVAKNGLRNQSRKISKLWKIRKKSLSANVFEFQALFIRIIEHGFRGEIKKVIVVTLTRDFIFVDFLNVDILQQMTLIRK
jgi:hypothetical protein